VESHEVSSYLLTDVAFFIVYICPFHHRVGSDDTLAQSQEDLIIENHEDWVLEEIILAENRGYSQQCSEDH